MTRPPRSGGSVKPLAWLSLFGVRVCGEVTEAKSVFRDGLVPAAKGLPSLAQISAYLPGKTQDAALSLLFFLLLSERSVSSLSLSVLGLFLSQLAPQEADPKASPLKASFTDLSDCFSPQEAFPFEPDAGREVNKRQMASSSQGQDTPPLGPLGDPVGPPPARQLVAVEGRGVGVLANHLPPLPGEC